MPSPTTSLTDLPIWTNTMHIGADSDETTTSTIKGTSRNTTVVTLTSTITVAMAPSSFGKEQQLFSTDASSVAYAKPSVMSVSTSTSSSLVQPESEQTGAGMAAPRLDYTVALLAALIDIMA